MLDTFRLQVRCAYPKVRCTAPKALSDPDRHSSCDLLKTWAQKCSEGDKLS